MIEPRAASVCRKTNETDISLSLNLDGEGVFSGDTGCGFFDHMLTAFCTHGLFDLTLKATGDTYVDFHHSAEDIGIALGQAVKDALGLRRGIQRCGHCHMPMDEALAFAAVDISGRGVLKHDAHYPQERCGAYDTCLTQEFLRAFALNAGATLHIGCTGENSHHMTEAVFKALGRALRAACQLDPRVSGVPSSKGVIA